MEAEVHQAVDHITAPVHTVPVPITAEEVEVPLLEQDTAKSRGRITQRIVPMTMMSMYVTEMGLRSSVMWEKKISQMLEEIYHPHKSSSGGSVPVIVGYPDPCTDRCKHIFWTRQKTVPCHRALRRCTVEHDR